MSPTLRRGFVDLEGGQVHYRQADGDPSRPALVLIHQSPGSSKQLEGLMHHLAPKRRLLAPDTHRGTATPAPLDPAPTMFALADAAWSAIDTLLPQQPFDLYGSHTGASIAMEIAIAHPDRVRRLVIDGMGLYAADEQSDILQRYAREIEPDLEGTHLMKVWHFCRDQFLFWPYHSRTVAGRLPNGLPNAEIFHDFVVEVLKAMRTYHRSYRAAFRHNKRDRLPQLKLPVLVACSPSDMLRQYFAEVAALIPGARRADLPDWSDPAFEAGTAAVINSFLEETA